MGLVGQTIPDFSETLEALDIKFSAEIKQLCRAVAAVKSRLLFRHVDLVKGLSTLLETRRHSSNPTKKV